MPLTSNFVPKIITAATIRGVEILIRKSRETTGRVECLLVAIGDQTIKLQFIISCCGWTERRKYVANLIANETLRLVSMQQNFIRVVFGLGEHFGSGERSFWDHNGT